jgi:ABC-2 type transport system ATP-binding protein
MAQSTSGAASTPPLSSSNMRSSDDQPDTTHAVGSSGPPAVRAEGLVRTFDDLTAVDGVDLDIPRGEIYGFLGPNGAGKSTTVRMLCTLLAPSGGRAMVAGYDVATQPGDVRLRIGAALQEVALDPKQTGAELLRLQGVLYGLPKSSMAARVAQLGELIDLTDALDRPIATYSGGMRRRLDLAAALVHNPDILFLDEPTTGLDPVSRAAVWAEVRRLNRELGMTIFLTTQYLEEADELADRVGIIDKGRIVAEGTPAELKRTVGTDVIIVRIDGEAAGVCPIVEVVPGVQSVEVRGSELVIATDSGPATVSPVAVALAGCEVGVRELTLRTPTLDDVFLDLTGTRIERDDDRGDEPGDSSDDSSDDRSDDRDHSHDDHEGVRT